MSSTPDPPDLDSPLERFAGWVLRGPLAAALTVLCLALLTTWAPQYLTWPLFADHDVFATAARSWDAGILPYRDSRLNNFPGTVYLFWILGKVFGWGKTFPIFAVDAGFVASLGVLMVAWSTRRFGRWLPGLIGYGAFLGYYLNLDYSQAAQRDWQGPYFAVSGLLILQTWPSRPGRLVSALAMAIALTFRPQAVLFLPAFLDANDVQARLPGGSIGATIRDVAEWGIALAAFLAIAFLPIVLAGLWPDFLRSLRAVNFGGSYNNLTPQSFLRQLVLQLQPLKIAIVPIAIVLLLGTAEATTRRLTRTWLIALLGVLLYAPLSPHFHAYLIHPITVVWAVAVALLTQIVLEGRRLSSTTRLVIVLLVMGLGLTAKPRFCNPMGSLEAIGTLRRGEDPGPCPTGYTFNVEVPAAAAYEWADYRDLLAYLRRSTGPKTRIANALMQVPAITGPTARLSAFPAESVAWLTVVNRLDEPAFAEALRKADDAIVVWAPAERKNPRLPRLDRVAEVIERGFEPEARFGPIEVRRRRGRADPQRDRQP